MNAEKWLKQRNPDSIFYKNMGPLATEISELLDEYGKYCSEAAYREGMNHGESGRYKDPEDWWNEFKTI